MHYLIFIIEHLEMLVNDNICRDVKIIRSTNIPGIRLRITFVLYYLKFYFTSEYKWNRYNDQNWSQFKIVYTEDFVYCIYFRTNHRKKQLVSVQTFSGEFTSVDNVASHKFQSFRPYIDVQFINIVVQWNK